jgi:hypothetical protein
MRKLCIEGVASHGGPESCVGVPRVAIQLVWLRLVVRLL